jgi:hydroxymethylglutaryl-CoA lyase
MAERVQMIEVAPRDGLQSDPAILSTAQKAALVRRAADAGLRRIEAVSFVNPKRVPQMADGVELMDMLADPDVLPQRSDCSIAGLVLNARGMGQAVEAGVDEANFVVVCTDTFAEKNQGRDTAGLVEQWREAAAAAKDAGLFTTVTLAASFGCPYEGEVPVERLAAVVGAIMQSPPDELALADSIGAAAPTDVRLRLDAAAAVIPDGVALRCHFHNTRNTGVANVAAAVEWGVRAVDASMGGIGGCPFAPNATGNVPTEDVAYMLARMGFDTGVDLQLLADSAPWLEQLLGHGVPGLLGKAGLFPRAVAV